MPANIVNKTLHGDEQAWQKAKAQVEKKYPGRAGDAKWRLVTAIAKKMAKVESILTSSSARSRLEHMRDIATLASSILEAEGSTQVLTPENFHHVLEQFQSALQHVFPAVYVRQGPLFDPKRPGLSVAASLDPKDQWINHIFENSRYIKLLMHDDGAVSVTTWSRKAPFRQVRMKSPEDLLAKITKWAQAAASVQGR